MIRDDRPIFLVGFMGSGKTAVGQVLARRLGWTLRDTDRMIEQREGRSIETIFRESGEAEFRELEWRVLQEVAGGRCNIVATGGGMFLQARARRLMARHGNTVWLDVPLAEAVKRVGQGGGRPLWNADDPIGLRLLYARRRAVYALARHRIGAALGGPEAVAERVLSLF